MENEQALVPVNELLPVPDREAVENTLKRIHEMQAVVRSCLKEGHDFGTIPGCGDKPTLLQPGAQKILMLFGLTSEFEILEQIQNYEKGFFAFTVRCVLKRDNRVITEGLGHANSMESKYRWRWGYKKDIPADVDPQTLATRPAGSTTQFRIPNDDPYTLVNTLLKIARKRAVVNAALTVGSLSDLFTQDVEDIVDVIAQTIEPPVVAEKSTRDTTKDTTEDTTPSQVNETETTTQVQKEAVMARWAHLKKIWQGYLMVCGNKPHAMNAMKQIIGDKTADQWTDEDIQALEADLNRRLDENAPE